MSVLPWINSVGCSGPPEQFAQVLLDTLPQDVTGPLSLLAAAHHKLVQIRSATIYWLHGNDGCCTVAGGAQTQHFVVSILQPQSFSRMFEHNSKDAQTLHGTCCKPSFINCLHSPFREVDGVNSSFQGVDVVVPQCFVKRLVDESQQTLHIDLVQRAVPA